MPWPGEIAVYHSPSTDGFDLLTTFGTRARIGTLVSDFYAGPTSRFDLANVLVVDLISGTLESVTDLTLLGGANALAIESAPGVWEIVQAGAAELVASGRYRLTRLLRGQRGDRRRNGQSGACWCTGRGARRSAGIATNRGGRSWHTYDENKSTREAYEKEKARHDACTIAAVITWLNGGPEPN